MGSESVKGINHAVQLVLTSINEIADLAAKIENEAEKVVNIGQDNVNHIRDLEEQLK